MGDDYYSAKDRSFVNDKDLVDVSGPNRLLKGNQVEAAVTLAFDNGASVVVIKGERRAADMSSSRSGRIRNPALRQMHMRVPHHRGGLGEQFRRSGWWSHPFSVLGTKCSRRQIPGGRFAYG